MKLWQKLTIDWPCALGDWLWAVLVMVPAHFLDRLTWRSAIRLTTRLVLAYFMVRLALQFAEIGFYDFGFLFTLDASIYWEASAALLLLTARGVSRQIFGASMRFLAQTIRARLPRFTRRARRTRPPVRHIPDHGEDEGAGSWIGAFA